VSVAVVDRRFRARSAPSDPTIEAHATRLIAAESARVGIVAALAVLAGVVAVSPMIRHNMFWTGDAQFFYAIARHPFASGGVSAHPLQFGVAYRYGRILFPVTSWLAAFGRPRWVPGAMLAVYVTSFGCWVATAAEHLRRSGRRPWVALLLLALPFSVMAFFRPEAVSDPMAGALLFTVYLYQRDGRTRAAYVAAALMILTREPLVLAIVPMLWMDWRERGRVVVRDAAIALAPYGLWLVWLRVRVGQFPFLDPGVSRRQALAAPLEGYLQTLRLGGGWTQWFGMLVALATLFGAVLLAARGRGRQPMTAGLVMLAAVIPFLGIAVFRHPLEAFRVLAPMQALMIVVALDRRPAPAAASGGPADFRHLEPAAGR
jgi:hypothetical protein